MASGAPRQSNLPRGWLAVAVAALALLAACSGGQKTSSGAAAPSASAAEAESGSAQAEPASLPPGAQPGLDDYDGDGTPDPTCGTQDFGAGLVLRIPCQIGNAAEPPQGTRLVPKSLFRLPSPDVDLTGISGSMLAARDPAGTKVFILTFNTDALFDTGSDVVRSPDTLDAAVKLINAHYAGGVLQVRGHTDGTGSASANQALSQRRADNVRTYLTQHNTSAKSITAVGLGSTQPLTEEKNPDGSANTEGRTFNRRVEIVIRLP